MKPIRVTEEIRAPRDQVYGLFTDLERVAALVQGIEQIEILSDGSFGIGTRWRETRVMFGRPASEILEVTACDPPGSYVTETESHGMRYRASWQFEPTGSGTRVTIELTGTPLSRFAKLASPLTAVMAGSITKLVRQDLRDMAAAAEGAAASDPDTGPAIG